MNSTAILKNAHNTDYIKQNVQKISSMCVAGAKEIKVLLKNSVMKLT